MRAKIGIAHIDELFAAVPKAKLQKALPNLPKAKGDATAVLDKLAAKGVLGGVPYARLEPGAHADLIPRGGDGGQHGRRPRGVRQGAG